MLSRLTCCLAGAFPPLKRYKPVPANKCRSAKTALISIKALEGVKIN